MTNWTQGDLVAASDGLPARAVRYWADEKLHYVRAYIGIFTTGMKDSWAQRVYIDLFSGPGRCLITDTNAEIDGSPIIAARARFPFTKLYLNDSDERAASALRDRLGTVGTTNAVVTCADANAAARAARQELFRGSGATLGLAFIDPTGFQIELSAIRDMTRGLSIDLLITFMTGRLRQFISAPNLAPTLDKFFGSSDWRGLTAEKETGASLTTRRLLDHYENKLRDLGYEHVDDHIRVLNSRESTIYHLVFASKHPRGAEFFKKIRQIRYGGQRSLFDEPG